MEFMIQLGQMVSVTRISSTWSFTGKAGEYLEESPSSYLKEHRRTCNFC